MPTTKDITVYKKYRLINIIFYIILLISVSFFDYIYSQDKIRNLYPKRSLDPDEPEQDIVQFSSCDSEPSIEDQNCFNDILKFNQKNFLLNSIGSNKNEDILIQYKEYINYDKLTSSQFFYGLTKNGRYFFSDKSSYSSEFNININENALDDSHFSRYQ